jgi:hypothetical protein
MPCSAAPPPDISRSAEREISGGGADVLRCDVPCDDVCDGSRILPRIDLVVGTKLRSDMSGGEVVCRYNKTLQYLWSFDEYLCTNPVLEITTPDMVISYLICLSLGFVIARHILYPGARGGSPVFYLIAQVSEL